MELNDKSRQTKNTIITCRFVNVSVAGVWFTEFNSVEVDVGMIRLAKSSNKHYVISSPWNVDTTSSPTSSQTSTPRYES